MKVCKSHIGGKWFSAGSPEVIQRFNPAELNEIVSETEYLEAKYTDEVLSSALRGFQKWSSLDLNKRVDVVENYLMIIAAEKDLMANVITLENGKTIKESYAEISSGLNEANYQLGFLKHHLKEKRGKLETRYYPLGISLLITPWNFPFATILRKLIPAIISGNSVIIKPSEFTPLTSALLFDLLERTEFPPGTLNLVLGDGRIGESLITDGRISAVSLTGSTKTGKIIKSRITELDIRFQAEMGGKNTVVVMPDADLIKAAKDIVTNSFACSGQWCTGTSRVIVHRTVSSKLIEAVVSLTRQIKIGNGFDESTDMGPLISDIQLNKVKLAVAQPDGAELIQGGKQPNLKENNGYFFEPTVFTEVDPDSMLSREEIFGPVLSISKVDSIDKMFEIINNTIYGLSFSVYTEDKELGEEFIDRAESGLCHINLPTAYRDPSLPLSGWKNSGYGLPEAGPNAYSFFTKSKAIYRNIL